MVKNVLIAVLAIAALGEGAFIAWKWHSTKAVMGTQTEARPTGNGQPPRVQFLTKGMKLADSQTAKFAYKIAPGDLSDDAKTAMIGWKIDQQTATDGGVLVTLTPTDSDDQKQVYDVRTGYSLYFVEMTPADDKDNTDSNLRDDYGVIVDSNGIVQ